MVVVRAAEPEGRRSGLLDDPGSPCGVSMGFCEVGVAKRLPILLGGRRFLLAAMPTSACLPCIRLCACLSYGVVSTALGLSCTGDNLPTTSCV